MSAVLKFYAAAVYEVDGKQYQVGDPTEPMAQVTITGNKRVLDETFSTAIGGSTTVYDYTRDGDFELFALGLALLPEGYLNIHIQTDTPVSASNLAASGSNTRWMEIEWSCFAPLLFDTDQVKTTSNANIASWYGDTAGVPTLAAFGSPLTGKVYKIVVKNPSTATAAAEYSRSLFN